MILFQDRHADLIINTYVDDVMRQLLELLKIEEVHYRAQDDPVKLTQSMVSQHNKTDDDLSDFEAIEWTVPEGWVKDKQLEEKVKKKKIIRQKRQSRSSKDDKFCDSKKAKTEQENYECERKSGDDETGTGKMEDDFIFALKCPLKDEDKEKMNDTYSSEETFNAVKRDVHCENLLPLKEMEGVKEETPVLTEKSFVVGTQNDTENVCS